MQASRGADGAKHLLAALLASRTALANRRRGAAALHDHRRDDGEEDCSAAPHSAAEDRVVAVWASMDRSVLSLAHAGALLSLERDARGEQTNEGNNAAGRSLLRAAALIELEFDPGCSWSGDIPVTLGAINLRWHASVRSGGATALGSWYDSLCTGPASYVEQARQAVVAGSPEQFLFHYGDLVEGSGAADAAALRRAMPDLVAAHTALAGLAPVGVAAYKPINSHGGCKAGGGALRDKPCDGEAHVFDFVAALGVPLLPTAARRRLLLPPRRAPPRPRRAVHRGALGRRRARRCRRERRRDGRRGDKCDGGELSARAAARARAGGRACAVRVE